MQKKVTPAKRSTQAKPVSKIVAKDLKPRRPGVVQGGGGTVERSWNLETSKRV